VLKPRPNGVIDSRGDRDFSLVVPYGLLAVLSDVPLDLGATEVCLEFPPGLAPAGAVEVATDALSATGLEKIGLTATAVIDEVSGLSRLRGRMSGFQLAIAYAALIAIAWMIAGTVQTRVLERRREIGLKRSLGAGQTRLGLEVLAESIGLSLGGGLVGVLAGWLLSLYFCRVEGWAAASPLVPALEVVGVLTGVACLAAIWPVKTAVGEEPMVALREGEGA
jgi:putative ABC transport system permease protein